MILWYGGHPGKQIQEAIELRRMRLGERVHRKAPRAHGLASSGC